MSRIVHSFIVSVAAIAASLVLLRTAAARPAWCKDVAPESPDLAKLSSPHVSDVLKAFVNASCAPTPEVEANRGQIEAARQAWSSRLGMTEADWADAVAFTKDRDPYTIRPDLTTDVLASATPLDQYAVITRVHDSSSELYAKLDTLYAADMFEANLSQLGRFAFLSTTCLAPGRAPDGDGMTGTEAVWAICQADLERFDLAKLFDEIRAATTQDGALKMKLRIAASDLPRRMKDHATEVQQMQKRDAGNRKLFEVASSARSEWSSGIGQNPRNTKLLELVLAMDSAQLAQSRKQFDGCGDSTAAALAEAVSALPARSFAGMRDDRENPVAGFASSAGLVLARSPAVNLAAIAFMLCTPASGTSELLKDSLGNGPGLRGPRHAALSAIKAARIVYDKMNAKLSFPEARPFGRAYPEGRVAVASRGGVVRSIRRSGDALSVELEKTLVKQQDCLASRATNRIERVRSDGTVVHERVCERSGTVVHDRTWLNVEVSARFARWMKPGVQFSAVGKDVIAIWSSKTAKTPSMVLGGTVK